MPRKSARAFLREALRAHRLETLAALVDKEAELTGRVLDAAIVREKLVLTLFAKWPVRSKPGGAWPPGGAGGLGGQARAGPRCGLAGKRRTNLLDPGEHAVTN